MAPPASKGGAGEKRKLTLSLNMGSAPQKRPKPGKNALVAGFDGSLSASNSGPGGPKKDFVTQISGREIESADAAAAGTKPKGPLVIPLTRNPWEKAPQAAQKPPKAGDVTGMNGNDAMATDDDLAVAALIADATKTEEGDEDTRISKVDVISMTGGSGLNNGANGEGNAPSAPLLMASRMPGAEGIDNDDDRFRHDIANRAANVTTNDECYSRVPIADFGEALLRGMGWNGAKDDLKVEDAKARPQRLGLGAMPKPPTPPPGAKKNKIRRPGEKPRDDKASEAWQQEAEKRLKNQKLRRGDLVWLRTREFLMKRGAVLQTEGVPGLNAIKVALEETGEQVVVPRTDAVKLTEGELEEKPFQQPGGGATLASGSSSNGGGAKGGQSRASSSWVVKGIRVRIVADGKYFRKKGDVTSVDGKYAMVHIDGTDKKREFTAGELETVIPSVGSRVVILRGKYAGDSAELVEKNSDKEVVYVERKGKEHKLSYDDVSQRA